MIQPPYLTADLEIEPFLDGLEELINEKITENLSLMDHLDQELIVYREEVRNRKLRGELDELGVYLCLIKYQLDLADYYTCQRWLLYWLSLFEKIPGKVVEKPVIEGRLSEYLIKKAKSVPIENLYSGKLGVHKSRLSGLCPFHNEKSPSFFIFTETNTFHCFGCQEHGDSIKFLMQLKELSFTEAVRRMNE